MKLFSVVRKCIQFSQPFPLVLALLVGVQAHAMTPAQEPYASATQNYLRVIREVLGAPPAVNAFKGALLSASKAQQVYEKNFAEGLNVQRFSFSAAVRNVAALWSNASSSAPRKTIKIEGCREMAVSNLITAASLESAVAKIKKISKAPSNDKICEAAAQVASQQELALGSDATAKAIAQNLVSRHGGELGDFGAQVQKLYGIAPEGRATLNLVNSKDAANDTSKAATVAALAPASFTQELLATESAKRESYVNEDEIAKAVAAENLNNSQAAPVVAANPSGDGLFSAPTIGGGNYSLFSPQAPSRAPAAIENTGSALANGGETTLSPSSKAITGAMGEQGKGALGHTKLPPTPAIKSPPVAAATPAAPTTPPAAVQKSTEPVNKDIGDDCRGGKCTNPDWDPFSFSGTSVKSSPAVASTPSQASHNSSQEAFKNPISLRLDNRAAIPSPAAEVDRRMASVSRDTQNLIQASQTKVSSDYPPVGTKEFFDKIARGELNPHLECNPNASIIVGSSKGVYLTSDLCSCYRAVVESRGMKNYATNQGKLGDANPNDESFQNFLKGVSASSGLDPGTENLFRYACTKTRKYNDPPQTQLQAAVCEMAKSMGGDLSSSVIKALATQLYKKNVFSPEALKSSCSSPKVRSQFLSAFFLSSKQFDKKDADHFKGTRAENFEAENAKAIQLKCKEANGVCVDPAQPDYNFHTK